MNYALRLPFRGDASGVIADAILNCAPAAPVRLNPDISSKMEEIITKALEKDRELRYQSAAEIRSDLKRLKREGESAKNAVVGTAPALKSSWTSRTWKLAIPMGLVAIVIGVGALFYSRRAPSLPRWTLGTRPE